MFWVVQNNLYNEYGYTALMNIITRMEIPHVVVKPVPTINHLLPADFDTFAYQGDIRDVTEPFVDDSGLVMTCGAITLTKIGKERGWVPGSFLNDDFTFEKWREHYGENLLNADSKVCRFDEVDDYWPEMFIRPCEDTKTFTGKVYGFEEFNDWRTDVLAVKDEFSTLEASTMVSYCSTKVIYREYRFFIVDGKIITASLYKRGDRVIHDSDVDQDIIDFTNKMVGLWQPARAFVIDVALTPAGCRVIEINNFNSAGFYACDVGKIVEAVEGMRF